MTVTEYGQQNSDVVLLLHGGGLSWWNYREVAQSLSEHYHVILPVLDGHADSDAHFTTIEENAARLLSWIHAHFGGQVLAIGGLSLGGQIAVEMLSQQPDICRYALIESALVKPMRLTHGGYVLNVEMNGKHELPIEQTAMAVPFVHERNRYHQ